MLTPAYAALDGAVHVWVADPAEFHDATLLDRFEAWLSAEERQRSRSFGHPRDRHTYLTAHAILRHLLSCYTFRAPEHVQFEAGLHGRPELHHRRLRFNISHTRGLVAWVFSLDIACGIDVEQIRHDVDVECLVSSVCSTEERCVLMRLSGAGRTLRLYELWSLKEAVLKACGAGIADGLSTLTIRDDGRGGYRVADELRRIPNQDEWYLHATLCGDSHVMAAAYHPNVNSRERLVTRVLTADLSSIGELDNSPTSILQFSNSPIHQLSNGLICVDGKR